MTSETGRGPDPDDEVRRKADRDSAQQEARFLAWELLPQLAYTVFFAVVQVIGAVVMKDITAAWGLPLMALGAWLILRGARTRRARAEQTLVHDKELDRSGASLPYLGWLIQIIGSIGPLMTWG